MQNLFHDGGFSNMGMSLRAMGQYEKGLEIGYGPESLSKEKE